MNIVIVSLLDEITGEENFVVLDADEIKSDFYTLLKEEVANDESLPF